VKVNPMDIQKHIFGKAWRGFDRDEVRTYLNYLAEEFAVLQRERDSLDQEVQTFHALVEDYRNRESILKNTLLTAQRLTEELKENARKQAEAVVHEAEIKADRLLELAQNRAHEVESSIVDLRAHRQALRSDIRSLVDRITHLLALQEEAENEDNVRFLRRLEA
jgi:cell division initiation protein